MVKVLVIKPSSLGDIIHSAGAVAAIARSRMDCRVTWVVNEEYADFVRELPGVFDVLPFPRERFRLRGCPFWFPEAAAWFAKLGRGFDVAVDLQGLQRSALMARLSGARERFGPRQARELGWLQYNRRISVPDDLSHAVDRVNYLAERVIEESEFLGESRAQRKGPEADAEFRIEVPSRVRSELPSILEDAGDGLIALCPGTRWASKEWPVARWAEFLELLRDHHPDLRPVFLGAPSEAAAIEKILSNSSARASSLAGEIDLWQTAAVLEASRAAVTMDSAPLHLAAAVGTPTVSLFGPTDPDRVAPRGPDHRVVSQDIECLGCYMRSCPLERRLCLPDIEPEEVLVALEEIVGALEEMEIAS